MGRGEAEAKAIAIEKETNIICLDDYAAKFEAMRLGLEVSHQDTKVLELSFVWPLNTNSEI